VNADFQQRKSARLSKIHQMNSPQPKGRGIALTRLCASIQGKYLIWLIPDASIGEFKIKILSGPLPCMKTVKHHVSRIIMSLIFFCSVQKTSINLVTTTTHFIGISEKNFKGFRRTQNYYLRFVVSTFCVK
jgi:hypothetical protein